MAIMRSDKIFVWANERLGPPSRGRGEPLAALLLTFPPGAPHPEPGAWPGNAAF